MYYPSFQTKKSGVPVLSKKEIDFIAERYIMDFQPDILKNPSPVDIDGFLENYLGTTPDYQLLSHNGIYLGMTVFNDTNCISVYDLVNNRAEYISAKANTVIIDSRLLEENQEHRYRFTAGHEAGHVVFHTSYFAYDPDQLSLFGDAEPAMVQCRVDTTKTKNKDFRLISDHDWMEWQANYFSGALLMPKSAVTALANEYEGPDYLRPWSLICRLEDVFNVSSEAAKHRLTSLNLIEPISETAFSAFKDFALAF